MRLQKFRENLVSLYYRRELDFLGFTNVLRRSQLHNKRDDDGDDGIVQSDIEA